LSLKQLKFLKPFVAQPHPLNNGLDPALLSICAVTVTPDENVQETALPGHVVNVDVG
jgi:hypothetical protein